MPKHVTLPREVAAKESRAILRRAIRLALDTESAAVRHNTRSFNLNRYRAIAALPDYDALKDEARRIKEHALANRQTLIQRLSESVTRNGGHFFFARNAQEARQYIQEVCKRHRVRSLVKGKSMTSEEIHLNGALEHDGTLSQKVPDRFAAGHRRGPDAVRARAVAARLPGGRRGNYGRQSRFRGLRQPSAGGERSKYPFDVHRATFAHRLVGP